MPESAMIQNRGEMGEVPTVSTGGISVYLTQYHLHIIHDDVWEDNCFLSVLKGFSSLVLNSFHSSSSKGISSLYNDVS